MEPVIYAADVGSIPQGNFGWARLDPEHDDTHAERDGGGAEIRGLVDAVGRDLASRRGAKGLSAADAAEIRAIRAQVDNVEPADMEAQRRLTADLRSRADRFV